ncbi:pyridoxamine 5'-phosphate oxidase family protein [Aurantimonas sp. HBX-1]|uniref:pyridoxamine 5'-phosphate oxidase family protein n=1 Tax=Aurantimonas sp. HBX-1 TaxID=2906072 RepID=UPI001F33DD02|nr:pyridoxamine 5'-phosphate oxidase family protein [Aurantimonas sp. HBX-1]UIJ73460.1 pyridoxamine 5'-phosphate oxidase family protein [Aurantimonas sp. HBX-1]
MTTPSSPFHPGEIEAQQRAGTEADAAAGGRFIRDSMPEQHREFFAALPFVVVASGDETGQPWVTILEGQQGFVASPDVGHLSIAARPGPGDPLKAALGPGSAIGMLGIELSTRRRNRLNGTVSGNGDGLEIAVRQSFGNCPQYINERGWSRVPTPAAPSPRISDRLDADQIAQIGKADTFFIGSGHAADGREASDGFDASHRGGRPGFVRVADERTILIPDYAGNRFFNTIGNIVADPRAGLLFVDFATGGMLHVAGRAEIDWQPVASHDPNAQRMITVRVETVVDRPGALSLRWSTDSVERMDLEIVDRIAESETITSFIIANADGTPLPPFEAGQYLPIALAIPGVSETVKRTYSLSGSPRDDTWRISVKRENDGLASRFFHDHVEAGDRIAAWRPAGEFLLPEGEAGLVLVSAGVGATAVLPMLHQSLSQAPLRPVWFVHGARDGAVHAFGAEVDAAIRRHSNARRKVFYSTPTDHDRTGTTYDVQGRVTAADLLELKAGSDAHYMICGPTRFIADLREGLETAGVPVDQIHSETFGPAG